VTVAGNIAGMEKRNKYRFLVRRTRTKETTGKTKCRWVYNNNNSNNNNMDLGEVGPNGVAQDRNNCRAVVYAAMNPKVP
jgi:hypothetical protein